MNCRDRLPQNFIDMLRQNLDKSPSGVWRDFNCQYRRFEFLQNLGISTQIMCESDVPSEPEVLDYSNDLSSPSTFNKC